MKWILNLNSTASQKHPFFRGFSLVELAIALAVSGFVMGGIWVATSHSWENTRLAQLKIEMFMVVKNIRDLHTGQASFTAGDVQRVVPTLYSQDVIPGDMMRTPGVGCSTGTGCTNLELCGPGGSNCVVVANMPGGQCVYGMCADHPWGPGSLTGAIQRGSFSICGWNPGSTTSCSASVVAGATFFGIELMNLKYDTCVNVALQNIAPDAPPGLVDILINGTRTYPLTVTQAQTRCTASSTVTFVYRLAAQS
ncbi:MAG: prepilin-type N-terminal cleavage/methylation domain-containing protein [Alphaproteobacteria bacterium]|nr:prepilin-type N-terminal cleavage/methylation domain-containing protein [Alphaproteobacteria bacterium]